MISFNDGIAESITIRVGEKNRQFKFSPDIDITDYDVKMVIIKPDKTFTITDCSVDDGFIIAAIPEQAAAVPGLGGYNIRVYDNDTNIYSAAGGVWVDDSLLQDGQIESVAEVNGYVFPDDFLTTDDLPFSISDPSEGQTLLYDNGLFRNFDFPISITPNPEEEATEILSTLAINGIVYRLPSGGLKALFRSYSTIREGE
jgi:hypothetical protein